MEITNSARKTTKKVQVNGKFTVNIGIKAFDEIRNPVCFFMIRSNPDNKLLEIRTDSYASIIRFNVYC